MNSLSQEQKQAFEQHMQNIKEAYDHVETELASALANSNLMKPLFDSTVGQDTISWQEYKQSNSLSTVTRREDKSYIADAEPSNNSVIEPNPLQEIMLQSIRGEDKDAAAQLLTLTADAPDLDVLKISYGSAFNTQKQLYDSNTTLYKLGTDLYNRFLDNNTIDETQKQKIGQAYILLSILGNLYNFQQQLADNFEAETFKFVQNQSSLNSLENTNTLILQLKDVNLPEYQSAKKRVVQLIKQRAELMRNLTPESTKEYAQFLEKKHPKQNEIEQIMKADDDLIRKGKLGFLPVRDVTAEKSEFEQFKAASDYVNKPEYRYFSYRTPSHIVSKTPNEQYGDIIEQDLTALNRGGKNYPLPELHKTNELNKEELINLIDTFYEKLPTQFKVKENESTIKTWLAHQIASTYPPTMLMGYMPFENNNQQYHSKQKDLTNEEPSNSSARFFSDDSTIKFELHRDLTWQVVDTDTLECTKLACTSDYNLQSTLTIKDKELTETLEISLRCNPTSTETENIHANLVSGFDNLPSAQKFWDIITASDQKIRQTSVSTTINTRLLVPALMVANDLVKNMGDYIKESGISSERLYRANLLLMMAHTIIEQHEKGQLTGSDCKAFMTACRKIQTQHNNDHDGLFSRIFNRIFNRSNRFGNTLNSILNNVHNSKASDLQPKFSTPSSLALAKKFNKMPITTRQNKRNKYTNIVTSHVTKGKELVEGIQETFSTTLKLLKTEKEILEHWKTFKTSIADATKCGMITSQTAKEIVATYEKKVVFSLLMEQPKGQHFSKDLKKIEHIRTSLEKQGIFSAMKTLFRMGLSEAELSKRVDKLLNYHCAKEIPRNEQFNHSESRTAIVKLLDIEGFKGLVLSENFNERSLSTFLDQRGITDRIKTTANRLMLLEKLNDEDKQKIRQGDLTTIATVGLETTSFLKAVLDNTTLDKAKEDIKVMATYQLEHRLENLKKEQELNESILSTNEANISNLQKNIQAVHDRPSWRFESWQKSQEEASWPHTLAQHIKRKTEISHDLDRIKSKIADTQQRFSQLGLGMPEGLAAMPEELAAMPEELAAMPEELAATPQSSSTRTSRSGSISQDSSDDGNHPTRTGHTANAQPPSSPTRLRFASALFVLPHKEAESTAETTKSPTHGKCQ